MLDQLKFSKEQTLLMLSASDLEKVFRKVISAVLTEREAAAVDEKVSRSATSKRLQKTPMTLTRWEQAGKIHPIKIGRTIYYLESEVKAIEEGKR